jgi:2-polyprenyl-3-methyl-5-hydroxy-6-metoxy-1,4-benzoquinol methylase
MTTTEVTSEVVQGPSPADVLCERLFGSGMGFVEIVGVYLGDRLGLYEALRDLEAGTSTEVAARAGIAERYAREWLEHQAAAGILTVAEPSDDGMARRYRLPEGCADALTDPDDLANITPLARALVALTRQVDRVVEAFRSGDGVPLEAYGAEAVEAQERMNRPIYRHLLSGFLAAIPEVHQRLGGSPGARVADLGAGTARSSIAMALAYPGVIVDAYDTDAASTAIAKRNIEAAELEDRVRIHTASLEAAPGGERYDVVTILEALHDMAHPVDVLRGARKRLTDGGSVIVMDENVGDRFEAPAPNLDAFFYGVSLMLCLPAAMAEPGAVGTGAVMRPATVERYAREAGFSAVHRLAVEHSFYRFYRLRP